MLSESGESRYLNGNKSMTEISINDSRCSGCGLCTRACPYLILELRENADVASVNPAAVQYCSHCGHCGAICPEGAITVTYPGSGPVADLSGESLPTTGQMDKLIKSRRSIREYKEKTISKEIFEQIFDTVRYAPTGMNGQSVRWLVLQDPAQVRAFVGKIIDWARRVLKEHPDHMLAPLFPMIIGAWEQGADHVCHGAPHLVFAYTHKDNPIGFIDAIIAMTHLDLIAPAYGLGSCWAGIVQIALNESPELMQSLGLPADHVSQYGMMIGYPKYSFPTIPARNAAQVTFK